ncbi:MAG: MarR family transcriptional regulator [Minwuia sp.]|nr:MarR family transcriptional regulator [Minwuia sp.]
MSDSGPDNLTERERLLWELLTSVGICAQLLTTRATEVLGAELPPPQFTMLNHFVRVPPPVKTVGDIARAFQSPQPGITKTAQKLIAKGFLAAQDDPEDGRRKLLSVTDAGRAAHMAALVRLRPDADLIFGGWSDGDLENLKEPLFRLKYWLDNNRDHLGSRQPDAAKK